MLTMQNMAIKHKLIAIIMLTSIVVLLLTASAYIIWEWATIRHTMVRNLSTQAEIIADNCKAALAFKDIKDAQETLGALKAEPSIVFGCIYTKSDQIFTFYHRNGTDTDTGPTKILQDSYFFGEGLLTVFKPIVLDEETIGTVCLQSDLRPIYIRLKNNAQIISAVLLIACFAAYLVSSRLQRVISEPILSLANVAKVVSEKKDYSTRALKQTNDEVGLLINAFNEMLGQIQQRDSELVASKEQLEVRVKERTGELTAANEQLTREIAVRKKTEEKLRKTEEKYRMQFEGALDAILVCDAETGIILDCNPAATRLVDREKSELIGKHQRTLHPPEEIEGEFSKTFKEHLKEKQGQTLETQVVTKKGEIIDVAITASLLEVRGKKIIQGVFRDITERKKAEQIQNQLMEKLESANKELKDFAYIVSHDLKAPLRGVKVLVEWISTDYADKLDEEGKEQINLLISRVERMHNLIDGILQYSRIGRVKEEMVDVNFNELVPGIIDMLAPPENITVTIENELPTIECEQTRITQVVQNLLSNAIKYIDKPQGQIKVGCIEQDGFWRFSVSDNGPGIEEQYFEKIFRMFQTLSPRDEFESTGVGLTVAKKIVESYGGRIWVESKVEQGSTFSFTLPKQKERVKDEKLQTSTVS